MLSIVTLFVVLSINGELIDFRKDFVSKTDCIDARSGMNLAVLDVNVERPFASSPVRINYAVCVGPNGEVW